MMFRKFGVVMLAAALVLLLFMLGSLNTSRQEPRVGDTPSYVPADSCPPDAYAAIAEFDLPVKFIHSCKVIEFRVDGKWWSLIDIWYGPAQDCPAGCIYLRFAGIRTQTGKITKLHFGSDFRESSSFPNE